MAKINSDDKVYWMRKVSLSKVRDTLLLVHDHGGLRYTEIGREGVKRGLFLKDTGAPLGHSHIYRYISTALKLGLLLQDDARRYSASTHDAEVMKLIEGKHFLQPLAEEEKLVFQKLLVRNTDCRKAFLWMFVGKEDFDWEEFVRSGLPVFISPTIIKNGKPVRTKKYETYTRKAQFVLSSPVKQMAIEWGLQLWARECSLVDEVYIDESKHILYPVDLTSSLAFDDYLQTFLDKYAPFVDKEWSFFPVDLMTFELAPLLRVKVEELQSRFFVQWKQRMPELIKFSSSSRGALTFRSSWEKTDDKVLKNFLKIDNHWVTHVLVHKSLWERVGAWKR